MTRVITQFRAAAVQAAPVWMDTDATIDKACSLIKEAARNGARLIVFPEVYVPAYPYWNWVMNPFEGSRFFRELYKASVLVPSVHTDRLCLAARETNTYVVIGINERSPVSMGTIYNTNLIIGPDGTVLGRHRKLVPTWAEKLTWGYGDGSSIKVYDTDIGRLGTLACGENTNTLARFALLAQGEQVHAANYPAFPFTQHYDMIEAIKIRSGAHAFEGKLFNVVSSSVITDDIIAAVAVDNKQRELLQGKPNAISAIFGPDGQPISDVLIDEEGIVYGDIDLEKSIEPKQFHDIIGHYNRFDVFRLSLNQQDIEPVSY